MKDNLLEELLGNANSYTPAEFGSGNLHLLSQPLSHWEWGDADNHSFSIPVIPSEGVGAADLLSDLLLEEEDALLLAASQQFEKRCGPLQDSQLFTREEEEEDALLLLSSSRKDVAPQ